MVKKIFNKALRFTKIINESNVGMYSASASFYCIIAIFPILVLAANILPLTPVSSDYMFYVLENVFPTYVVSIVHDIYFEFSSIRGALISFTAIMIIWSAGNGVWALMNGLNSINLVKEKRNWFLVHFISILYMALFMGIFLFFLLFMVFGNNFNNIVVRFIPEFAFVYSFLMKFRFLFAWIILLVFFMFLYRTLTSRKVHLIAQFPGALFSGIAWSLLSFVFSKYVDNFASSGFYGSFTIIIFSFLWVYWSIYILFVGAVLNTFWFDYYEKRFARISARKAEKKAYKRAKKNFKKGKITEEEYNEQMGLTGSPEGFGGRYE